MHQNELECGCSGEMGCVHYEWPKSSLAAGNKGTSVMGLAAEGGIGVDREQIRGGVDSGVCMGNQGQRSQQAQQAREIQGVEQPLGQSMVGELQQGDFDVGMGEGQSSEGGAAEGGQHRLREDGGMDLQDQSSPPTQGHMLQAGTSQSSK